MPEHLDTMTKIETHLELIKTNARKQYSSLGAVPAFKELAAKLWPCGYKVCCKWDCPNPIKLRGQFNNYKSSHDRKHRLCKTCQNPPKYRGNGKTFTQLLALTLPIPKPTHTLKFADFLGFAMVAVKPEHFTYMTSSSPLATKGGPLRGKIAENVSKQHHEYIGYTISPAEKSIRVDGLETSEGSETYDYNIKKDDVAMRRQEIKNARMYFNSSLQRWEVTFEGLKTNLHDDTILLLEGLTSTCLFKWGGQNLGGTGKAEKSSGKKVVICGEKYVTDFDEAYKTIRKKLMHRNEFLIDIQFSNPRFETIFAQTTRADTELQAMPLMGFSGVVRGDILEELSRVVLRTVVGAKIDSAPITARVNGVDRGPNSTSCDYLVDGEDAEHKSSVFGWDTYHRMWIFVLAHVKRGNFYRLFISLVTPKAVHIFEHDAEIGYSTTGKDEETKGGRIVLCASGGQKGYTDWKDDETYILKFLGWHKSKYIARVEFQEGDLAEVMKFAKPATAPVSASVGSSSTDPLPASVASSSTDPLPVKKGVKRQARPIVDSDSSSDSDADIGIGKRPTRPIVDSSDDSD